MTEMVEQLKAMLPPIYEVLPGLKKKTANELAGACPWCGGEDRFVVFLDTGRFLCRGCSPTGGDSIDFHARQEGTDFKGLCKKYLDRPDEPKAPRVETGRRTHLYTDEHGAPLYRKTIRSYSDHTKDAFFERYEAGQWVKGLGGIKQTLYNQPGLKIPGPVYLSESEKDADRLTELGLVASSFGGAENWRAEYAEVLAGRGVIILAHNDEPGRKAAEKAARNLVTKGCMIKIIQGDSWGTAKGADVADWIQAGHGREDLLTMVDQAKVWTPGAAVDTSSATEITEADTWGEPLLFGEIETPEIPCNLLPVYLGEYCQAVALATQTPSGLAVMMGISTVAACLQKKIEVAPFCDDYREPVSLWTVTALDPGNRKTAVKSALTGPLTDYETVQAETMRPQIKKVAITRDVNLKRIEQLKAKAAKPDTPDKDREGYQAEIFQILDETPQEIKAPRLWIDDVTPERLQDLMAENSERIALISDEGGVFEVMSGLYSNGRVNMNVFLQAHAGAPVRVDRQGRSVTLYHPALSFGLAVQPDVIADLSQGNKTRFRGNGTLARFLYCIPRSTIGRRDVARRYSIPETIKAKYHAGISSLLEIEPIFDEHGREQARILTLAPDALQVWIQFSQYIESKQGPDGEFYSFQDWTSKLPGAALRIAGLLHAIEHGVGVPTINQKTIERALDLCDLLISHARRAFELMGADQAVEDAKQIFKWITGRDSFTEHECLKQHETRVKKSDRLRAALKILGERNIISEPMKRTTKGRPSVYYNVNPGLYGGGHELA